MDYSKAQNLVYSIYFFVAFGIVSYCLGVVVVGVTLMLDKKGISKPQNMSFELHNIVSGAIVGYIFLATALAILSALAVALNAFYTYYVIGAPI